MVNAFEALLRSPMLFRREAGYLYLNAYLGRPITGITSGTNSRGRSTQEISRSETESVFFSWGRLTTNDRWHSRSANESVMEIKDLKKKKDVYEFTVHYTEYRPQWGSRKSPNTSWCHLPSNAQIYIENFKVELYKRVMEKYLGKYRTPNEIVDSIPGLSMDQTVSNHVFRAEKFEELLGENVTLASFEEAQKEIYTEMKAFFDASVHKSGEFEVMGRKIEGWMNNNSTKPDFYFQRVKERTFKLSLRASHTEELLVSPVISCKRLQAQTQTMENGRIRTSNMENGSLHAVHLNYSLVIPQDYESDGRDGMMNYAFDNLSNSQHSTGNFLLNNLCIARGGTKARPQRGAWLGPYTGISKFHCNVTNRTYLEFVSEYGMPGAIPALKNFKKLIPSVPTFTSMESMEEIEIPNIDISPIELGHVNLYRLGNSMYDLSGKRLSDFIVPSQACFILSLSNEKVLTIEEEDQVECVGNDVTCKQIEQTVLPAGAYLVEVKEHCNLHHDMNPVREYHRGMGKVVNRAITTRNVLRIIKVNDGQIREDTVDYVGAGEIATTVSFDNFEFDERW